MTRSRRSRWFAGTCLAAALLLPVSGVAQDTQAIGVPADSLEQLGRSLLEAGEESSATRQRRAYKRVVRTARQLYEASAAAEDRWRVLDIVFQGQKRLLVLDPGDDQRDALLETSELLSLAPDEYAELRLEADLLLSERRLSAANADVEERAMALEELLARYRDTPGEAKSLMMASQIAPKLEAFDLEVEILRNMQLRFADHHGVIEFRRKSLAAGRIEALFRGEFIRADGTSLVFPVDRLGHQCLLVFWSGRTPGFEHAMAAFDNHGKQHPGRFDIYSLNLDDLPDAGESGLRELGLDWKVLRLPGGKENQVFRTYGVREPVSILVNAYGYTLLTPTNDYGMGHGGAVDPYKIDPVRLTDERYLAQLQSLFAGDFLLPTTGGADAAGADGTLEAIQACFTAAPFRYRLTRDEALARYEKAASLGAEAIERGGEDPELWRVRHCRILALIGMWKFADRIEYLEEAVSEARTSLSGDLPEGADVIPRFCLALHGLRGGEEDRDAIVSSFVGEPEAASAGILAAGSVLALYASSRDLHQRYRSVLLEHHDEDPDLWAVVTFLRDRFHTLDLLKVKLNRPERRVRERYGDYIGPRGHAINHGLEPMTERLPDITLTDLEGDPLQLPADGEGKLTLLMFVEPPAEPGSDFPVLFDRNGEPTENDHIRSVMRYAMEREQLHQHGEVEVVAAFLCDDADRVRQLVEKNGWDCRAAIVPGGLENPMVRQLGVLSADRIPNVFLLRRDGTIAWHASGFSYKSDFGYPFAMFLAMKVHIEVCDIDRGFAALEAGDASAARHAFSGPFELEKDERYGWRSPRFHGRAMASLALGDPETALVDVDTALEAHGATFDHGDDDVCLTISLLRDLRARILVELGRSDEAAAEREASSRGLSSPATSRYAEFHLRLHQLSSEAEDPGGER